MTKRARVYAEQHALAGRYWVYEIRDTTRPAGAQVQHSGVRTTWQQALTAARATLQLDTTSSTFSIQPASITLNVLRADTRP